MILEVQDDEAPALLMGKIKGETIVREFPGYRQLVLIPMDEQWDCRNDEQATGQEDCPCSAIDRAASIFLSPALK